MSEAILLELLENLEKIKDLKQSIILLMTSQPQLPPLEAYQSAKQIQSEANDLFTMVSIYYSGPQTKDILENINEIRKQITFLTIIMGGKTIEHLRMEFKNLMANVETYATTLELGFDYYICEHVTKLKQIPMIINAIRIELDANYRILEERPAWRKDHAEMDEHIPNIMRMTTLVMTNFIDYMEEIQKETGESYDTIVEKYVNSKIMQGIGIWLKTWFRRDSDSSHILVLPPSLNNLINYCDVYEDIYEQYLANPRRLAYIKNATSRTLGRPRSKPPRQTTGGRHKSRKCKNGKTKCKNGKTKYRH